MQNRYQHLICNHAEIQIGLTAPQQALIFALDDDGIHCLHQDNIHLFYGMIAEIKQQLRQTTQS